LVSVKVGIQPLMCVGFAGVDVEGFQCGPRASKTAARRVSSYAVRSMVKGTRLATAHPSMGLIKRQRVDTEITTVVIKGVTDREHLVRCVRTGRGEMFAPL
jgi:hypothetical protein